MLTEDVPLMQFVVIAICKFQNSTEITASIFTQDKMAVFRTTKCFIWGGHAGQWIFAGKHFELGGHSSAT